MNIFVLDTRPHVAAIYHNDSHCNKMVLESAQLLCTAHRVKRGVKGIVKRKLPDGTIQEREKYIMPEHGEHSGMWEHERGPLYWANHINHPCAVWTRSTAARYRWLYALYVNLCREFTHRRKKVHKSQELITILHALPRRMRVDSHLQSYDCGGFVLAMPDEYKCNSAVESYRAYYRGDKRPLATWTHRPVPNWWY